MSKVMISQNITKLNLLITGGSGFIGQNLLPHLVKRYKHVFATTTQKDTDQLKQYPNLTWVSWDTKFEKLPEVCWEGIDHVCHMATPRNLNNFPANARALFSSTIEATFYLIEKSREIGIQRFILLSTGDVVNPSSGVASESDTNYRPASFYGVSKASAEIMTRFYASQVNSAIIRIFYPYGPGGDRFLINRLLGKVLRNDKITIENPQGILISPTYIDDIVEGILLLLESKETGTFHITGPNILRLKKIVETIGKVTGIPVNLAYTNKSQIPRAYAGDIEKSKTLLNYGPKVSIEQGILRMIVAQ